jgi:stage III sporulation protein AD
MDIVKIVGIGVTASIAIVLLRQERPDIAILLGAAAGIMIFLLVVNMLTEIVAVFTGLINKTGTPAEAVSAVLKIIGVGYLTEFAAGICEDTGNKGLGDKIVFGGKVIILFLALPIIKGLFEIISALI